MNILLPSETFVREFDAKLLLACHLAARGHEVVVGSRIHIHMQIGSMPRGLYLSKDVRGSSKTMFGIMRDLGYSIDALDEEGLLILDAGSYRRQRVTPSCLQEVKTFYAWGKEHAEIIEKSPGSQHVRVVVAGNPRMDFLRPEMRAFYSEEVERIHEKHPQFVLVNTNFGRANPAVRISNAAPNTLTGELAEYFEFRKIMLAELSSAIEYIARKLPKRKLVIRPHPGENIEYWKKIAGNYKNVTVDGTGSVVPWLLAADALVHNGCTTGIEAFLLDKPVIEYRPLKHKRDLELPSLVSHEVTSLNALERLLGSSESLKEASLRINEREEKLSLYIARLGGELSAECIANDITESRHAELPSRGVGLRKLRGLLHAKLRKAVKSYNSHKPQHKNSKYYTQQRFPDIDEREVAVRIARILACQPMLPRINVRGISRNIFLISRGLMAGTDHS